MSFFDILKLCAGLVFFLYGMSTMSDGLEKAAGSKLEIILKKMTSNVFVSIIMGTVITAIIQSSSATTVMLVGLVNSGLMTFESSIGVIFGANIGTTVTAWFLSLVGVQSDSFFMQMVKPQNFAPILAIVGIAFMMMSKSEKKKNLGMIFVGFTVLIYGMDIMSGSVEGLADSPKFTELMTKFNNPVIGVIIGAVVTAVIQSSSASVGILQALSLTGTLTYTMAVPIILGQNIGTCATAMISCLGAGAGAKKVSLSHTLINVLGTVIFLPVFIIGNVALGSYFDNNFVNPASIAVIHTIFNLSNVIILAPFTKLIARLANKLVKEKSGEEKAKTEAVYLDERLFRSPAVAVMECDNYASKMAVIAKDTILKSLELVFSYNKDEAKKIKEYETTLDVYEDQLGTYLVRLSSESLTNNDARTVSKMLHNIGDFERLGDHALNLQKVAEEIHDKKVHFSENARKEITLLLQAIAEITILTTRVYEKNDVELAARVEPLEQVIDRVTAEIKAHHINRLQSGDCTIELGFVLSDLLTNCERISDHCSNIAVAVIEAEMDSFDTHSYLRDIKHNNEQFTEIFEEFKKKYDLHAQ
ncbi:MAG: Na/Pi cotransporter family protein [Ruminococcaceae bacterium]|nr:Na/Pi cotransporter family protein [Oscillospiraceae bacterium]